MALAVVAYLLPVLALLAAPALAQGTSNKPSGGGTAPVRDVNPVSMSQVRENYFKRYPFAKDSNEADARDGQDEQSSKTGGSLQVENGDSAYKQVEVKCDYFAKAGSQGKKHVHYKQQQEQVAMADELASQRDSAVGKKGGWIKCEGLPISDTMFQIIDRENRQRLLELAFDPERHMWRETTKNHMQTMSAANSAGAAAESNFKTAVAVISDNLINVANERSAVPTSGRGGGAGNQAYGQAIYMVQQMYKSVFVPLAILLLLPGAVMTQVKGLVVRGFLGGDEDSINPFAGIMRAIIAVFLIPATQLIVSYAIDVGNALAYEVRNPARPWIDQKKLTDWASEQTFAPPIDNVRNAILPPQRNSNRGQGQGQQPQGQSTSDQAVQSGLGKPDYRELRARRGGLAPSGPEAILQGGGAGAGAGAPAGGGAPASGGAAPGGSFGFSIFGFNFSFAFPFFPFPFPFFPEPEVDFDSEGAPGEGKAAGQLENEVDTEDQLWLSGAMQVGFNTSAQFMGGAVNVLAAYQLVYMCYLFLLGPIAAAFYAWPSGVGSLFKKVFSNWVDGVVVLALWRFWWCVILAVMTQRLNFVSPNAGSPSEMMVYNCFLALLMYIPFQPFNFHPGPIVANVLDKAASGGGGGGAPGGGAPGGGTGAQTPASATSGQPVPGGDNQKTGQTGTGKEDKGGGGGDGEGGPAGGDKGGGSKSDGGAGPPPTQGGRPVGQAPSAAAPPPTAASPSVPGAAVSAPPPSSGGSAAPAQNAAVSAVRSEMGGGNIEGVQRGTAPTVAGAPRGTPKLLVNTTNPSLARNAGQAMSSSGRSPSFTGGAPPPVIRAAQPPPSTPSGGKPGAGSAAPPTPPAAGPTNVNVNVNVTGSPASPDSGGGQSGPPPPAPSSPASGPSSPPPGPSSPPPGPDMQPPPSSSPPPSKS